MISGLSIVIPVYNSGGALGPLIDRLVPVLDTLADAYEVILVNDGSSDGSAADAMALASENGFVHFVDLMRNYGQHNALLCGIREAQYPFILTMDDDLQHPPEELHKLIDALVDDIDVVYGAPEKPQHGFLRGIATRITKTVLQRSMGVEAASNVSALRLFRSEVSRAFADYQSPLVNIDVLLTWGTSRFAVARVRHDARTYGQSNYSVGKLITHAVNMMTGFSVLPLQWASMLGLGASALGVVLLLFTLVRFVIEGRVVHGFVFLASSVALFAGVQLFALGILGEYMARVHLRTMNKPPYVVRDSEGDSRGT